jgi:hypothetical protein
VYHCASAILAARERIIKTVRALEHGARTEKTLLPETRGLDADFCRPACMQALGPRPFGEIFDDARGHAAGDAQRIDGLLAIEAHRRAHCQRRRHRTQHAGWMKTRLMNGLGNHHRQAAQHFNTDHHALER